MSKFGWLVECLTSEEEKERNDKSGRQSPSAMMSLSSPPSSTTLVEAEVSLDHNNVKLEVDNSYANVDMKIEVDDNVPTVAVDNVQIVEDEQLPSSNSQQMEQGDEATAEPSTSASTASSSAPPADADGSGSNSSPSNSKPKAKKRTAGDTDAASQAKPKKTKVSHDCFHCETKFTSKKSLTAHELAVSAEEFKCRYCQRAIKTRAAWKSHERLHIARRPRSDNKSKKTETAKVKVEPGLPPGIQNPEVCQICRREFISRLALMTHLLEHTGGQKFKCEVCSREFVKESSLVNHMRSHTGEKPFGCMICNEMFETKRKAKLHMVGHMNDILKKTFDKMSKTKTKKSK